MTPMRPDTPDGQALWAAAIDKLERLLELPPEARAPVLQSEADERVRGLLADWLRSHERKAGVLDAGVRATLGPHPASARRQLGRWQLEARIGSGGMATVHRARSVEPPLGQQAAVKLMALGVLAQQGSERFLQEQRTLSRMRHPGIASLLDAGVAEDGTPWFAMALVEGERIDHWCDARGEGIAGRVALALQVCEAVAYAHRNLVIHRDIKPSNVLVDEDGHAILLDFGIARLAEDVEGEQTATALRMMTPEYAAPEQFTAAPASTAMDVHGLGALLYRLLTGAAPRAARAPDGRPLPLARAGVPGCVADDGARRQWSRQLRGDLDTIVMKALAQDPEQRYATVDALAEDLRRWRATRPILAHPPSFGYRARRYLQRHRWSAAATAAVLLATAAGVAGIAWQGRQARLQAERAELTSGFLREVFAEANPLQRGRRGADIEAVLREAAVQAPRRFAGRPDLQAETLQLVGELQRLNGDNTGAADTLARALASRPDGDGRWNDARRRATLSLAASLAAIGKPAEARVLLAQWLQADPGGAATGVLHCRGHSELSRLEEDIALGRERLERVRESCLALPAGTPARIGVAASLSSARRHDGDHAPALELAEREEAALAALPLLSPEAWIERLRLATERAKGLEFLRRHDDAERATAGAIELAQLVVGDDSVFLAAPLQVQAGSLNRMGRSDEAGPLLRRALALIERDGRIQNRPLHARVLLDLGVNAHLRERAGEAEAYWRQALDAFAAAGQHATLDLGTTLSNLAHSTAARGAYGESADFGRRAVSFLDAHAPERLDKIAMAEFNLCMALAHQGEPEAIAHCARGIELDRSFTPADLALLGEGQQYLADAHCLLRQWPQALDAADRAIAILAPLEDAPASTAAHALALARHHRAEALAGLGRGQEARDELAALAPGDDWPAMTRARNAVRRPPGGG